MNTQHGILITQPISLLKRDLKMDYSRFTEAFTKTFAYGFVGNMESAIIEATGMLSALGLKMDYSQILWLLIHSSLLQAVKDLLDEHITSLPPQYKEKKKRKELIEKLDSLFEENEIFIDHSFFNNPKDLQLLVLFQTQFSQWLEAADTNTTKEIIQDLPDYFVFALISQWRNNYKTYECLTEVLKTPFTEAYERQQAWIDYAKQLQKQIDNVILDDRFNLRQVYVPLRAYFEQEIKLPEQSNTRTRYEKQYEKIVVDLTQELNSWVQKAVPRDAVRLISGGPGCGKSSFVKVFAEHQAKLNKLAVIFIPLHRFNLHHDLVEGVNDFARRYKDDCLPENPLDSEKPKLLIFDGLDEYAMQSKAANEAAQQFVDEVRKVVHQYNNNHTQLQVIITGRDVAMQTNARQFSKSPKTLNIIGFYVSDNERQSFKDSGDLLIVDQRNKWWENYAQATGNNYTGIPDILKDNLVEITSQPLLNYLVALSYEAKTLDFSSQNNLNTIYRDLLERILEREQQEKSPNSPLANLKFSEFFQALKEVALAAWHGDGRSITQQDIQNYFKKRGLQSLLEVFEDKEKKSVIRLLLAFYFRQTGIREEDAQGVFEFTHKSFWEYLVACRIVDMVDDIQEEMVSRQETKPHLAWDENEALQRWIALCGIRPIDRYLFKFLCDEMQLQNIEQVHKWQQESLASLIGYMLEHGMPMERINPRLAYYDETLQARNAEEALLATLNACARVTQQLSKIKWPSPSAFAEWVSRIQGLTYGVDNPLFMECLSFLDLHDCQLHVHNFQYANFYGANLENSNFKGSQLRNVCLEKAILKNATLIDANLMNANLIQANLEGANLNYAYCTNASFEQANLKDASLKASTFFSANLKQTHFEGTNLKHANFSYAIWIDGKKCLPNSIGECRTLDDENKL